MLRNATELERCVIGATDGAIGKVHDLYFDDQRWVIRYLVVNSGAWLLNRAVLISPISLIEPTVWHANALPVSISKDQVKNSPAIDTDKPVSRQYEQSYYSYYGYPYYWGGAGLWGSGRYPSIMMPELAHDPSALAYERAHRAHDDPHLRSCREVNGYHLQATDGDIGHVAGYLIDDKSWAIRFLIVNTSNWWVGHQVLIASEWIDSVAWKDHKVATSLTRGAVKTSPPYDSALLLDFAGEQSIYRHYGRPAYGDELVQAKVA